MKKKAGDDIINKVEVRCKGIYVDKYGNKRPCNRMFFVGSPGFDIHGKPKELIVKCPKCSTYISVTCEIMERVIIRVLATVTRVEK